MAREGKALTKRSLSFTGLFTMPVLYSWFRLLLIKLFFNYTPYTKSYKILRNFLEGLDFMAQNRFQTAHKHKKKSGLRIGTFL